MKADEKAEIDMKVTEAVVVEAEVVVKVEAEDTEVFEKIEHPERKGDLEKKEAPGLIEAPEKIDLLELRVNLIEVAEAPEKIDLLELKVNLIEGAEAPEKIDLPELKVKPIVVAEAPEKIDLPELKERPKEMEEIILKVPRVIEAAEVEATEKDDHSITTKVEIDVEERDDHSITTKVEIIDVEERDDHMHHVHMMDTA